MTIRSQKMIERMVQRWFEIFHEELDAEMKHLAEGAFKVESFLKLAGALGIDFTQLPGMVGEETGLDPYRVLGLDRSASDADIKDRYREMLRLLHPDTAAVPGTEYFLEVVLKAYQEIKSRRNME